MVESVDTPDLKSCGQQWPCRFDPGSGYLKKSLIAVCYRGFLFCLPCPQFGRATQRRKALCRPQGRKHAGHTATHKKNIYHEGPNSRHCVRRTDSADRRASLPGEYRRDVSRRSCARSFGRGFLPNGRPPVPHRLVLRRIQQPGGRNPQNTEPMPMPA